MRKTCLFMLLLLVFALTAVASDYADYYTNMPVEMQKAAPPQIPENSVRLTDFGAIGNGVALNTEAFSKAISALSKQGGGHLVVPAGIWLTGPISLKDNIDLHVERNGVIMAAADRSLFIKNEDGKQADKCTPLIYASKRQNISITGEGAIDGNGALWRPVKRSKVSDVEWADYKALGGTEAEGGKLWFPFGLKNYADYASTADKQEAMRTHLIRLTECQNVLVQGITIQNSPKFHLIPTRCENVIIDGVTIRCPWNAQNGDALDISSCRRVLIVNNTIDAGDDGICMKGGAGQSGVNAGPCRDILIQNNTVYHAHGGFVIGSEFSGGMQNIVVRNNRFSGTDTGLRFKSSQGRGGKTEQIFISDIVMTDIRGEAIVFECTYFDNKVNAGKKKASSAEVKADPFTPEFTDIHIKNVICRGAKTAVKAHGLVGLDCIYGITIDNSVFFYTKKDKDIDQTADITLKNCQFVTYK